MGKKILIFLLMLSLVFEAGCSINGLEWMSATSRSAYVASGAASYENNGVTIVKKDGYFDVKLDFTKGFSHRQIGEAYMQGIIAMIPNYESLVDAYLAEISYNEDVYSGVIGRTEDIKRQVPKEYLDEIDGMISKLSGGTTNKRGDGKLSSGEFYLYSLVTDVFRLSQCCFTAVFGSRSETGKTMLARNLDWYGGGKNEVANFQSVTTLINNGSKVCTIGYMGFMGVLSGFNDSKVFTAIIDSPTGQPYNSQGKRSYTMDLRYALENKKSLDEIADYMKDDTKYYAFNHNIVMGDPNVSKVLENNFSGTGPGNSRVQRALRSWDSPLNDKITWGFNNAIGCVNSFVLKGNYDNHNNTNNNKSRWNNIKKQLTSKGDVVTLDELKDIASYDGGSPGTFTDSGDLYNRLTQQIVVFQPDTLSLEVFFHPTDKSWVKDPNFIKIPVFDN